MSNRNLVLLWIAGGVLIFSLVFGSSVERTQEARVLETAREMMGRGWEGWLVPHCNGQVRLRKPPLAYWAAAVSFKIFGVHDWAGRIPFALASWLTLAATYAACRPVIGQRAALLAAAALLGSYFFIRFGRLAETDVLSTFFITAAMAGMIHGAIGRRGWKQILAYQLAGMCIGLAVMSKGPPAIFPMLFLIALAWALRRWRIISEFLLSGGFLIAVAVALPWWVYVSRRPEFAVVGDEMRKVAMGLDHPGPIWFYLLVIFVATLPWSVFLGIGLVEAVRRFRRDLRARIILLWIGCMIIPMSLVGKKQDHYLMAALPALAAAAGWSMQRVLQRRPRFMWGFSGMMGALGAGAVLMAVGVGWWWASRDRVSYPKVAAQIQARFGYREMVLYKAENLPICFYLGRTLPYYQTQAELVNALLRSPGLAIIWEQKERSDAPPPGVEKLRIVMRKRDIVVYKLE